MTMEFNESDQFQGNKTIALLTNGTILGDCGTQNLFAPELSELALDYCVDTDVDGFLVHVRETSDEFDVLMKDATVDRTTTMTGNVAEIKYDDLLTTYLNDESIVGTFYADRKYRVLGLLSTTYRYGKHKLMLIQSEINTSIYGQKIADQMSDMSLTQNVAYVSTGTNFLSGVKTAVSNAFTILKSETAINAVTVKSYGVNAILVLYSALTAQAITDYHAQRLYVGAYGTRSAKITKDLKDLGCDFFTTDDPHYVSTKNDGYDAIGTIWAVPHEFKGSGYVWNTALTEPDLIKTGTRRVGYATTDTDIDSFSAGHKLNGTSTNFSYTTTIYIDSADADNNARVGLFFNMDTDVMPSVLSGIATCNGYALTYAKNGTVKLLKFVNGEAITELDSDTWTAYVNTNALAITVTINGSGITVAKSGSTSLTGADTTHKAGWLGYFREKHGASFYGFASAAA